MSQYSIFHSFQSHHKHYGWFVLKVFTGDEMHVYLLHFDNENLKTINSYKLNLALGRGYLELPRAGIPRSSRYPCRRVTPLFKQLCEKLFCLRKLHCKHQCTGAYLHGLLYASIAANALLHQLLSVSFCVRTKCLNWGSFPYFLEPLHARFSNNYNRMC